MRKQILILLGFSFSLIACQQNEEIGSVEDNANPNELTTRAASMRRVPTQAEKDNLKKDFPNLDVNNISVTGEATGTYNCIAYSMGITNKWIGKYYHEATNMEYLYDPTTKLCFSFFADERDESLLEVYGLSSWASNLVEKQISIATLANLYTIIGL